MSHNYSHGGCEHDCDDSDHLLETGIQYSLFKKIDFQNLDCLNESINGSGKTVFKTFEERLNFDKFVESDADEELIFNIPFTGNIKLKGFRIIGANDESHPGKARLFKNQPKMTFDDVRKLPDQEFDLHKDVMGEIEYSTKVVTFASVNHLTIHIPSNFGNECTKVYYIGLRGEFSEAHVHGVTICNYEVRPNLAEHKGSLFDHVNNSIQ